MALDGAVDEREKWKKQWEVVGKVVGVAQGRWSE